MAHAIFILEKTFFRGYYNFNFWSNEMKMTYENAKRFINSKALEELEKDKSGRGYICPICRSGTGSKGTGITTKDDVHFTCFAGQCFTNASWIDILAIKNGIDTKDTKEAISNACRIYNIELEENATYTAPQPTATDQKSTDKKDYTADFEKWHKAIYEQKPKEYLTKRGITADSIERFNIGYCANFMQGLPAIIFPTSKYSYNSRSVDDTNKQCRKSKDFFELFNIKALETSEQPIFIVEGEFDAISIIQAGGNAIALGGTTGIDKLLDKAKELHTKQTLIIALDNDTAGINATEKLKEKKTELLRNGLDIYFADTNELYFGKKDANEALQENEFMLMSTVEKAREAKKQEALSELQKDSVINAREAFSETIRKSNSFIPTGFTELDKMLDGGLYAGLYVVGAISSLGKTTLCLQIGDQIAKAGSDVLIFSLEMSKHELIAKSISRLTSIIDIEETRSNTSAKTTRGILASSKYAYYNKRELELIEKAKDRYFTEYAKNLYIYEGMGNIGTQLIRQKVEAFKTIKGKAPIVIIDYLQILAPAQDARYLTDKQNTDFNISELKRISRDFETAIIGISSFNRDNYTAPVNMASFKESGAIEYSSDVLIGLQYKAMQDIKSEKDNKQKATEIFDQIAEKARNKEPIEIQLKILKSRNGIKGTVDFDFYPMFNKFKEPINSD